MTKLLVAALLFLFTIEALADVKNREKAKFDLISSIEDLVNIDECRKGLHADKSSVLPRVCNSLPYLSKYFFDPRKDRPAIDTYLNNEEAKITEKAFQLSQAYNITKLGKMTLSMKCVKNKDPIDLDVYLNKIMGTPVAVEQDSTTNELIPIEPNHEPRNPAADKKVSAPVVTREPMGLYEQELSE